MLLLVPICLFGFFIDPFLIHANVSSQENLYLGYENFDEAEVELEDATESWDSNIKDHNHLAREQSAVVKTGNNFQESLKHANDKKQGFESIKQGASVKTESEEFKRLKQKATMEYSWPYKYAETESEFGGIIEDTLDEALTRQAGEAIISFSWRFSEPVGRITTLDVDWHDEARRPSYPVDIIYLGTGELKLLLICL
ncbi:unnamed protein product [Protopolystoma xenopodis]|uniref:Uncharacterized protein n=1 Tax=Protopolystoma xenopodis TaxID=117903 RepID=A0A3S5CL95_9PLAT|nr:unnamed protein product [Protopolystoma xenopodis]